MWRVHVWGLNKPSGNTGNFFSAFISRTMVLGVVRGYTCKFTQNSFIFSVNVVCHVSFAFQYSSVFTTFGAKTNATFFTQVIFLICKLFCPHF